LPRSDQIAPNRRQVSSELAGRTAAVLAGIGWAWAAGLLVLREHWVLLYIVVSSIPPVWGVVALPLSRAVLLVAGATTLAWAAYRAGRSNNTAALSAPTAWLLAAWIIPLASFLRLAGMPIPHTFFEPLLLAGVTGAAARAIAAGYTLPSGDSPGKSSKLALTVVVVTAIAACAWWMFQGLTAFRDYLLGYCDFAQYGWRVANTWAGRGFMMETPGLPAFWDHFCPAVALLTPIWGMTHDVRLFIVLQAVCLALPAVFIHLIVRRLGGGTAAGCVWAAAYLVFPSVSQLNLNYSYGWHPVSVAMVLLFAAISALVAGRKITAAFLAVFACTWQDYVAVNLAWFALVMTVVAWSDRRIRGTTVSRLRAQAPLAGTLPPWAWLLTAGVPMLYFFTICQLAPFSHEEAARFANLGDTPAEVVLSPILRPEQFWGSVFRYRCVNFLLALSVPLGISNLLRGWKTLLGAAMPLGVLVAWDFVPATSIAFQYQTLALPVLFAAAISGATIGGDRCRPRPQDGNPPAARAPLPGQGLWIGGIGALAASLTASLTLGAMPWSSPTLNGLVIASYPGQTNTKTIFENRRVGSAGNASLDRIVARVGDEDSHVLATGRIAAHLLMVERLEPVHTARQRWSAFADQAGPGRSAVELFDWVVLDLREQFSQSEEDMQFVAAEAERAGFDLVHTEHDIYVYRAPEQPSAHPDR